MRRAFAVVYFFVLGLSVNWLSAADPARLEQVSAHILVIHGTVNGVRISAGEKTLCIYGDPRPSPPAATKVLFTDSRRDLTWEGEALVRNGAEAIVPALEAETFARPEAFWERMRKAQFHNYAQFTTKVPVAGIPVARAVADGDTVEWEGLSIKVVSTPGYSKGGVSYLVQVDGQNCLFAGNLFTGDGKLLDLYSFQDAIPEAKIGGYHGYAARLGQLVNSLTKIQKMHPDLIIPSHGPLIKDPEPVLAQLLERVKGAYSNYLSIDALRWYFGDEHIMTKARRVLGAQARVNWLPMAETNSLPNWVVPIDNSRLILSEDGSGFLIDCGGKHILEVLERMRTDGKLRSLQHLFISHYHDDHTDQASAAVMKFGATVLACDELRDVLEKPSYYCLPCLTANPLAVTERLKSGAHWKWKEFDLTAWFFPGQTLYHQALLVKKEGNDPIFFVGDSFTPSGIDDYCLQNRNLLGPGLGFFQCLKMVKELPAGTWLVNQHVNPMFRYQNDQIPTMEHALDERLKLFQQLFSWDNPNYALDESWARIYPYQTRVRLGEIKPIRVRALVTNHSATQKSFSVVLHGPVGWNIKVCEPQSVWIAPGQEGVIDHEITPPASVKSGLYVVTGDVNSSSGELKHWIEGIVQVAE